MSKKEIHKHTVENRSKLRITQDKSKICGVEFDKAQQEVLEMWSRGKTILGILIGILATLVW